MREYSIGTLMEIGSNLDDDLVQRLLNAGEKLNLAKGQRVYAQGDPAPHVFFLLTGQAKSVRQVRSQKQ
jgi:CRP-like cAMP-binding protein